MLPSVSIIIPAKNEERHLLLILPALWESIRTYGGRCEVIVVDNGSTDGTPETAGAFGCQIIADIGSSIGGLRNRGAAIAANEVIAFLDADCIVAPQWITYCVDRINDSSIGLVGTRAIPDLGTATWVEEGWYRLVSGAKRPDHPRWIGSSNMFLRKSVFKEVGGFPEHLATSEDVEFCNLIRQRYLIVLENRISTIHLRESKNLSELVRREMWRGKTSIRQLLDSDNKLGDCNSIVVSVFFLGTLPAISAGIFLSLKVAAAAMSVLLSLPLLMMAKKRPLMSSLSDFIKVYLVAFAYILARSAALVLEAVSMLKERKKVPRTE